MDSKTMEDTQIWKVLELAFVFSFKLKEVLPKTTPKRKGR